MSQPPEAPGWSPRRMAWMASYTHTHTALPRAPLPSLNSRQVAKGQGPGQEGHRGQRGANVGGI